MLSLIIISLAIVMVLMLRRQKSFSIHNRNKWLYYDEKSDQVRIILRLLHVANVLEVTTSLFRVWEDSIIPEGRFPVRAKAKFGEILYIAQSGFSKLYLSLEGKKHNIVHVFLHNSIYSNNYWQCRDVKLRLTV